MNRKELRETRGQLTDKALAICERAKDESRELTDAEQAIVDSIVGDGGELDKIDEQLGRHEALHELLRSKATAKARKQRDAASEPVGRDVTTCRTLDGKPAYLLGPKAKWQDLPHLQGQSQYDGVSIGECIRAMITGKGTPEVRAALSENSNTAGGFLVPERLAAEVFDLARALAVLTRAGVGMVPMDSETMSLARVTGDPTIIVKGENAAFTPTDVTFDRVLFTAKVAGCLIECSRELAEDAVDFPRAVTRAMAGSLANYWDYCGLRGDGTSTYPIQGIINYTGINTTAASGAIAWSHLNTAVALIRSDNQEPTAYVTSPTIAGDLAGLTSGDGTNSAAMWQGPDPSVAPLMPFHTSNMPDATAIVGDFSRAVWGIRSQPMIEMSTDAGDAFSKHQLHLKITQRADFQLLDEEAFCSVTAITT